MSSDPSATSGGRFHEEGDWIIRQFIAPDDLQRSPEEYVARHAHAIGAFSFHFYRFTDPVLGSWVRRVGELLGSQELVEQCRGRFLSPEEAAIARQHEAAGL